MSNLRLEQRGRCDDNMGSGVAADLDALLTDRAIGGRHHCSGGSRVSNPRNLADRSECVKSEGSHGKLGPLSPFLPCSWLKAFFHFLSKDFSNELIKIGLTAFGHR